MKYLLVRSLNIFMSFCLLIISHQIHASDITSRQADTTHIEKLSSEVKIGDVVYIQVSPYPFKKVSETTRCWVNHVGIVVGFSDKGPVVAESRFPFSSTTYLSKFIKRSDHGRVAIARLNRPITKDEENAIWQASQKRMGIFYDTGFDLNSHRQFCSRFVREVLNEATGVKVGTLEKFSHLLTSNPDADTAYWKVWYFGSIPWERMTVTPASLYRSENLVKVFDGKVV